MNIWYVVALVLFVVGAVIAATRREAVPALTAAGLAAWVLPVAWAAVK